MRENLINHIVCPKCGNPLELKVFEEKKFNGDIEIHEGLLTCRCGEFYPIIGGIPRFLLGRLKAELIARYDSFFDKYPSLGKQILKLSNVDEDQFSKIKAAVIDRFGYEWTTWSDYDADNFLDKIHPVQPEFFKGKLGLEGGCGAGRHTRKAVSFGAEMVAVDLSWGVESAYRNTLDLPRAHIVQADILKLPLKVKHFDFAYSLGVLQVVADPPAAFSNLVRHLKAGAPIMTWTSSNSRKVTLFFLDIARAITTRLPNRVVKWLSVPAAMIDYGFFIWPYKILSGTPGVGAVAAKIPFPRIKGYAKYDFRVIYVDWFDRFTHPTVKDYCYEDMRKWHEQNNLHDVKINPDGYHAWITFGRTR